VQIEHWASEDRETANEKHKRRKYASSLRFIASYLPQKYKGKPNNLLSHNSGFSLKKINRSVNDHFLVFNRSGSCLAPV
jgi:hypothetical protein